MLLLNNQTIYTESKAVDCMLQLDVIKRYTLPKNCSHRYEIKIVNSKKYDSLTLEGLLLKIDYLK